MSKCTPRREVEVFAEEMERQHDGPEPCGLRGKEWERRKNRRKMARESRRRGR